MAAPHTSRAAAGPMTGGREVHERLVQLPRLGTIQGRPAGTTGVAETTAATYRLNSTGAEFAATPAAPVIMTFPAFIAVPVYPNGGTAQLARFSRAPGSVNGVGAPANGIIAYGSNEKILGNHVTAAGGVGVETFRNGPGNGTAAVGYPS